MAQPLEHDQLIIGVSVSICNFRTVAKYGDELKKPGDTAAIRDMIKNNEIDTMTNPFVLSSQVLLYFDCVTLATKSDSVALVIRTSFEIQNYQWETFLMPLKWQCWFAAIALAIIILNIFKIYLYFQEKVFTFLTSIAVLFASLTVTSTSKLYETLEDLLDVGKFQINAHKDHSMDNILKSAKSGTMLRLWKIMEKSPTKGLLSDKQVAYDRVFSGYNAFLHYYDLFGHDIKDDCRYQIIKTPYNIYLHVGFRKLSKYTEVFGQKHAFFPNLFTVLSTIEDLISICLEHYEQSNRDFRGLCLTVQNHFERRKF
uniref:Ionotropic glutamate receptor C-terminal domain-containing protein n=1 Tax=Strigamia maritima TaxID=126957 RepID=T1IMP1_STRMM